MNAFGALLWAISFGLLSLGYGAVLLINGVSPTGWSRTGRFYWTTSLLTLPLPLCLLTRSGPAGVGSAWILAAALRQMLCLPLFLMGLALTGVALWQKRPAAALIVTALLNVGVFVYIYARAL